MEKNSKIKILHIIPQFTTGGAEQLVLHYGKLLDKNIFDVVVANTVEDGTLRPLFEANNIRVKIGSRSKDGGRLGVALKLIKFVKEYKPDVIHTHLFGADLFGWIFKILLRLPVIWISTQHNVEFDTSYLRRFVWKRILRRADKVIAVADKVKKYDIEQFNLSADYIEVVKNGIDIEALSRVSPMIKKGSEWQLGIVGRLSKQKGHIYLLEALGSLKKYNWKLHVFGDGVDKTMLMELASKEEISDRIVWHGVESHPQKLYESFEIIIQPSLWEGLSLVIMEALCAGRFIIASKPAAEELIEDGISGKVVEVCNVDDIIKALQYSFDNELEIERIAATARINALKTFDIRLNVEKLSRIYLEYVRKNSVDVYEKN